MLLRASCLCEGEPYEFCRLCLSGAPLEQKPLSEVERVVDTFVAPSKTFTDLRRSANWFVPWLLLAIASVAMVFVVDKKLGMEKVVENQMVLAAQAGGQAR